MSTRWRNAKQHPFTGQDFSDLASLSRPVHNQWGVGIMASHLWKHSNISPSKANTAVGMGCCQPGCKKINTRFWRRLLKLSWCQKKVRGHVVATAAAISKCERNETVCYFSTLVGSVWEMSSKGNCRLPGNRQQESFQNIPHSLRMPLTYRNFSLKPQQQQACSPTVLYTTALMTSYSRVKS